MAMVRTDRDALGSYAVTDVADENEWQQRAACQGMNAAIWFPDYGDEGGMREAKRICSGCEVRMECLKANLKERFGVWGGLGVQERRKIVKIMEGKQVTIEQAVVALRRRRR